MDHAVKIFILAGGLGTRIRPLFPDCPKPLVPFHGKPFLQWQIELLASQGFSDFVLCVGYLAGQIQSHFGDGSRWGITISYVLESVPLGTGGAIQNAANYFTDTIFLLNGDTYLNTNYQKLLDQHRRQLLSCQTLASLCLVNRDDTDRYGKVDVSSENQILGFQEKSAFPGPGLVNGGVYLLEPKILEFLPIGRSVSLEQETLPLLISEKQGVFGITIEDSFIDMGTPDGYASLLSHLNPNQSA